MEVIYLLIPVSLGFVALIIWALIWAVQTGQFDDLEGPAHRILMDDEGIEQKNRAERVRPKSEED